MDDEPDDIEDIWADVRAPIRTKMYQGKRSPSTGKCHVYVWMHLARSPLPLCLNVARHSPDGFEWGYSGSGPAQLALALLCDHFGKGKAAHARALGLHQRFKDRCVVRMPHEEWELTSTEVSQFVQEIESQLGGATIKPAGGP